MFFSQERNDIRQFFIDAWAKHRKGEPLIPLEVMVVSVVEQHPEYHALLEKGEAALGKEYLPEMGETNPFLHLGMHISIHEQLSTRRPPGILEIHQQLTQKYGDPHTAEHEMMDCLGEMIWSAQRENRLPDENDYLRCLREKKLGQE